MGYRQRSEGAPQSVRTREDAHGSQDGLECVESISCKQLGQGGSRTERSKRPSGGGSKCSSRNQRAVPSTRFPPELSPMRMILHPFTLPFAWHFPKPSMSVGTTWSRRDVCADRISLRCGNIPLLRLGWAPGTSPDATTYIQQLCGDERGGSRERNRREQSMVIGKQLTINFSEPAILGNGTE